MPVYFTRTTKAMIKVIGFRLGQTTSPAHVPGGIRKNSGPLEKRDDGKKVDREKKSVRKAQLNDPSTGKKACSRISQKVYLEPKWLR